MTSLDGLMPGYRASTLESASVTGRRVAVFLAAVVVGLVRVVVPHLFTLGGLVAFVAAAWLAWGAAGGLVVLGVSLLLFEWKIRQ